MACILLSSGPARAGNQTWTGLGPRAKSIEAIARDPINPSRMWAATFGAGVYRSLDGGATWIGYRTGLVNTYVRSLAANPKHPDSLYCGTNDGVFLSTDGGVNWKQMLSTIQSVRGLAIHPRRTGTVYAATYGTGIYKSLNAGQTWGTINSGLVNPFIRDVALRPTKPDTLLAATGTLGGIHRSLNGGLTWSQVADTAANRGAIEQIQFDKLNPNRVYAVGLDRGVIRSLDGGTVWARWNQGVSAPGRVGPLRGRALAVVDTVLYYGSDGSGAFYRTQNGPAWQQVTSGLKNLTVDALLASATAPGTAWAGTDGDGVFRTLNRGASWTQLDGGLLTTFGFALAVRPSSHVVYAGCGFGDQFWRSTDQSASWTRTHFLFTHDSERSVVPDPVVTQTVYITAYGAGVYRSQNDGVTWTNPDSLSNTLKNVFVRRLVAWPGQTGHLFVGTGDGVWESTNGGATWTARKTGLPVAFSTRSLALVAGTPATLYAGSDLTGVWRSIDGGQSWAQRSSGITNLFVHDILVDSRNTQTVYAATDNGIFRTLNGGTSWTAAGTGLPPNPSVRALVQDRVHTYVLFCAVWGAGVFESRNGGTSWQSVFNQAGLSGTKLNVHSLAVDGALSILYAGSEGGVQALSNYSLMVSDAEELGHSRLSLATWPNPLRRGDLHIGYTLANPSPRLVLEVYDVAGHRVRTLANSSNTSPGPHDVVWDTRDRIGRRVAAGIYFVRLQSNEGQRTARVVVTTR